MCYSLLCGYNPTEFKFTTSIFFISLSYFNPLSKIFKRKVKVFTTLSIKKV